MSEPLKPHQACACSKTRPCAFHKAQQKKLERVAKPLHDKQKVEMGIEELRARYARPHSRAEYETTPPPRDRLRSGRNGWQR